MNKINNKGFTLVELLSVITILAIVIALVIPASIKIINDGKQTSYDLVLKSIYSAAQDYTMDNKSSILALRSINGSYDISLEDLADLGYIKLPILNHLTNENFDAINTYVTIQKKPTGDYIYTLSSGSAVFTILGDNPDTVSCSATGNYSDPGASVLDPNTGITSTIYGSESLALSQTGNNLFLYSYTDDNDITYNATRNVIITNSNIPTITITGGVTEISVSIGETVTPPIAIATDICEGELDYTITSNVNINVAGIYSLTYTVENGGGIIDTEVVTVNVIDPFEIERNLAGKITGSTFYASAYNHSFSRMYTLKSDGTTMVNQVNWDFYVSGAIDGYRTLPITDATYIAGHGSEELLTVNASNQVKKYTCLCDSTTCSSSILTNFGNNVVQVTGSTFYASAYDRNFSRIYTLNNDGTVMVYQDNWDFYISGAIDGYRTLPITNAKFISAHGSEELLTITEDNEVKKYTCLCDSTTCSSSTLTNFGSDVVQVTGSTFYASAYNRNFSRIYTLNNDGTVMVYQDNWDFYISGAIDGYRTLPITEAKAIAAYGSEELLVLNSSNEVVKYTCIATSTTCSSSVLTSFGNL